MRRQQEKDHGSADLAPLSSSPLATPSLYPFRSRPRAGPGQARTVGPLLLHTLRRRSERLVRTVPRLRLAFQSAPQRVAWRSSLLRMPEVQLSWSRTTDRSGDRQPSIPPWKRDDTSEDIFGVIADRRRIFEWAPDPGGDGHTYRVGHPVVDDFLHFAGARARPNTVRACAHDLKVFFSFVAKELAEVAAADVRAWCPRSGGPGTRRERRAHLRRRCQAVGGHHQAPAVRGLLPLRLPRRPRRRGVEPRPPGLPTRRSRRGQRGTPLVRRHGRERSTTSTTSRGCRRGPARSPRRLPRHRRRLRAGPGRAG